MSLRLDQAMDPPPSDQERTSISIGPPLVTSSSTTTPTSVNPSMTDTIHHTADNVPTSRLSQYGKQNGDQEESLKRVDTHHYHPYNTDSRGDEDDEHDMSESDGESSKSVDSPTGGNVPLHTSSHTSPVRDRNNLSSILRPPPTTRMPDIQPQPTTPKDSSYLNKNSLQPSTMYATSNGGSNRSPTTTTTTSMTYPTPSVPLSNDYYGHAHVTGQKRRYSDTPLAPPPPPPSTSSSSFEIRGSHGPRDELRYETWTSKQLRKKCSHLKLRGLKNVKKHVMVEALYRYYHTHPSQEEEDRDEREEREGSSQRNSVRYSEEKHPKASSSFLSHPTIMHRGGPSSTSSVPTTFSDRPYTHHKTNSKQETVFRSMEEEDESKLDSFENEMPITSEDVIRLIDVMLSSDFVDRWISELSRWQFWVDVREKYIQKLKEEEEMKYTSSSLSHGEDFISLTSYSRNTRWNSMQLWEMWKELTFSYTKTCFEFTTAGANECDYLYYCKGRPDVYYLHQRLHSRPDLLHLIKSNEYMKEKESGLETTAAANALMKVVGSPRTISHSSHKRFKRLMPTNSSTTSSNNSPTCAPPSRYGNGKEMDSSTLSTMTTNASNTNGLVEKNPVTKKRLNDGGEGPLTNGLSSEGSTENSETIEETSVEKTNSNSSSSRGSSQRSPHPCGEELTEQKYFGLLLQNFEALFESLHNKKILLAALRKDKSAPDHLIADLHDDIHVLSALKKEFRNKLRQTLE